MNAESVPILTSSIIVFNGKKPAINEAITPTIKIEKIGDLKSLCNFEKVCGKRPSRDIE
jgi:hypothetical protein